MIYVTLKSASSSKVRLAVIVLVECGLPLPAVHGAGPDMGPRGPAGVPFDLMPIFLASLGLA